MPSKDLLWLLWHCQRSCSQLQKYVQTIINIVHGQHGLPTSARRAATSTLGPQHSRRLCCSHPLKNSNTILSVMYYGSFIGISCRRVAVRWLVSSASMVATLRDDLKLRTCSLDIQEDAYQGAIKWVKPPCGGTWTKRWWGLLYSSIQSSPLSSPWSSPESRVQVW